MSQFTSGVIDLGMAVHDMAASLAFYCNVVGFEEVSSFDVSSEIGGGSGLSDGRPFQVRVLQLAGVEGTKLKLIEAPNAPRCCDTRFIHSVRGVRYLTVRVADIAAACEKAKGADCAAIADGPVEFAPDLWIAVIRDPDDNMIELVGPNPSAS